MNDFATAQYDVAIVGCGPVGATLANLLRVNGIRSVIFDQYEEVFPTPRAGGIDDETLRVLQAVGVIDQIFAEEHIFQSDIWFYDANGNRVGGFDRNSLGEELLRGTSGYYRVNMFHQPSIEKILRKELVDAACIDTFFGYDVSEVTDCDDFVSLEARARETGEEISCQAQYVVGCDGANSIIQPLLKVDTIDLGYSEDYLVVDAIIDDKTYYDTQIPDGAYFVLDPTYAGVIGKAPHGWVRLDFRRDLEGIGRDLVTQEDYDRATHDLIVARGYEPEKFRVIRQDPYTFFARTSVKWRVGRFLVAGDAAHLTPPWAGQGLNMGIRDAANIAFKLKLILAGRAHDSILDTYDSERRPVSMDTIQSAVDMGKLMETRNPLKVGVRTLALRLLGKSRLFAKIAYKFWQRKPPYHDGLIGEQHKLSGSLMFQPEVTSLQGKACLLDDLIGLKFALISINSPTGNSVHRFSQELGGVVLKLGKHLLDTDGSLGEWFRKNRVEVVLLRPDRYIFDAGPDGDALCASLFKKLQQDDEPAKPKTTPRGNKMLGLRIYNAINGILYSVYGLLGVFVPSIVFEANALEAVAVHGTHSIRALWGAIFVLGAILLWKGQTQETARTTTMMITLVSIGLVAARLTGISLDGTEGWTSDQYGPLIIEGSMAIVGGMLCSRTKQQIEN